MNQEIQIYIENLFEGPLLVFKVKTNFIRIFICVQVKYFRNCQIPFVGPTYAT